MAKKADEATRVIVWSVGTFLVLNLIGAAGGSTLVGELARLLSGLMVWGAIILGLIVVGDRLTR